MHEHASEQKKEKEQNDSEHEEASRRSSPSGKVVYKAILKEADDELKRPSSALFWSGLAAGLSMGFSLVAEGLLRSHLPDAPWRPLIAKFGYSVGFLIVILGRQQLFTENTLTPVLPVLREKKAEVLLNMLRLWGVVLVANLIGAVVMALAVVKLPAFEGDVQRNFIELGHEAMRNTFWTSLIKGVFAGWLIALIVWLLPFAESSHFFVIIAITYIVGLGKLTHIIAGTTDVSAVCWAGEEQWTSAVGRYVIPTLIGNIVGGVTFVAALNHAQVVAGGEGTDA